MAKVYELDGQSVTIGGMIAEKKIKYTKNDKIMAFLTLEDLVGTVEVIVFPKDYEANSTKLVEDSKVFIRGRVSVEEEKDGKLICEKITLFDDIQKKLWVKFPDMDIYEKDKQELYDMLSDSDGKDKVIIYIENPKAMKELPRNRSIHVEPELIRRLQIRFGVENVKVV